MPDSMTGDTGSPGGPGPGPGPTPPLAPLACPDLRVLPLAAGAGPNAPDPPPAQPHADEPAPPLPGSNVSPPQPTDDVPTPAPPGGEAAARPAQHPVGYTGRDQPAHPGTPKGEPHTHAPEEKLGLMVLALRDGVQATARAHGLSRRTLQHWLSDFGGSQRVLNWLQAETLGAFLRWEQGVYAAASRMLEGDSFDKEQLWITLRKLVDARAIVPAQAPAAGRLPVGVGVDAAAGSGPDGGPVARVTVRLVGDTGDEDIIQVDRGGTADGED